MSNRLDIILSKKFNISRNKAQTLINEGKVKVGDKIIIKSSFLIDENDKIEILDNKSYVSRGAFKLLGAISAFKLDFSDLVVLDMGSSTGGFTQVAIENGAKKVYAVDVGTDILDKDLAKNNKIVSMQNRDVRSLKAEEICDCQIVIGDLSFISLNSILPIIKQILGKKPLILLFKPQFECGKDIAKKFKGVIKDRKIHIRYLKQFLAKLSEQDYYLSDITFSPIKGREGNIEYLLYINGHYKNAVRVEDVVNDAFKNFKE